MDSLHNPYLGEEELMDLVRDRLAAGQTVRYLPFRGVSMLPLLRQGRDSVALSPLPEKLQKYDLPVYQYPSGKYVMHRIVRVEPEHYICLGDNTYQYETITRDMMLGIVTVIRRGEKLIPVTTLSYRLYCRIWCALYPMRRALKKGKGWLRRCLEGK